MSVNQRPLAFWNVPTLELLDQLQTTPKGLTSDEAQERLTRFGANVLKPKKLVSYKPIDEGILRRSLENSCT